MLKSHGGPQKHSECYDFRLITRNEKDNHKNYNKNNNKIDQEP